MTIYPWKTLGQESLAHTPIFSLSKVERESPTGQNASFFVVDLQSWVNVFAITEDNTIVLIRQYRHGTDTITLEVPGGGIDATETPLDAAMRELREETGFTAQHWYEVGCVDVNPAIQNNRCWTFLAIDARLTDPIEPDEHEDIEVQLQPVSAMNELIATRQIQHSLVVSGWYFAQRAMQEITRD